MESKTLEWGINPAAAGLIGGMSGGIMQAYATMGAYYHAQIPPHFPVFIPSPSPRLHDMHEDG